VTTAQNKKLLSCAPSPTPTFLPRSIPSPALAELGSIFGELSGDRAAASTSADAAIAPYRPREPGWFLGAAGTAPEA
jgi:hypothetical protein